MVCIIPSHNQKDYIRNIIRCFEKQTVLPKLILFVFDRCNDGSLTELLSINSTIPIDYVEKNYGSQFSAGATRDYGLKTYIERYGFPENVFFMDGDCYPNEYVIEEHMENLSRLDAPIISCGRRIQYDENNNILGDKRDFHLDEYLESTEPNTVFTDKNGKLCHCSFFHEMSCVSHSCSLAMNRKAIDLCYLVNGMLGSKDRVFHSAFDGYWGGEDNFVGQILFSTHGYIFSCSNKSVIEHRWHPSIYHNHRWAERNMKKCKILLNNLKSLIIQDKVYSDSLLKLYKKRLLFDTAFIQLVFRNGDSLLVDCNALNDKLEIIKTNSIYEQLIDISDVNTYLENEDLKKDYLKIFYSRNIINIKSSDTLKYTYSKENRDNFLRFQRELFNLYITVEKGVIRGC